MVIQTPSPSRRRSASFRTRDSNAAWAAAQGLLPITEGFTAPGFVPAQLVGGVTYSVHSPQERQLTVPRSDVGRELFVEHTGTRTHRQASPTRQQQPDLHSVRCTTHILRIYTDSCIVRLAGTTAYTRRYRNATRHAPVSESTYAICEGHCRSRHSC